MYQLRKHPLLIKVKMETVMANLVTTFIAKLPQYRLLSKSQATWQASLLGRNGLKAWANTDPHICCSLVGLCFLACPQSPESRPWLCEGWNGVPLKAQKGKSKGKMASQNCPDISWLETYARRNLICVQHIRSPFAWNTFWLLCSRDCNYDFYPPPHFLPQGWNWGPVSFSLLMQYQSDVVWDPLKESVILLPSPETIFPLAPCAWNTAPNSCLENSMGIVLPQTLFQISPFFVLLGMNSFLDLCKAPSPRHPWESAPPLSTLFPFPNRCIFCVQWLMI